MKGYFLGASTARLSTFITVNTVVLTLRGLTCAADFAGQRVFEITISSECFLYPEHSETLITFSGQNMNRHI